MSDATEHIAGWEAAGLIDRETADRLRAASDPTAVRDTPAATTTAHPRSAAAALFGPSVTISEVFAYLGGAFLLAAWSSFMSRTSGPSGEAGVVLGAMALLAAGVLGVIGLRLMGGGERASRASGVAFLLVSTYVAAAAAAFGNVAGLDWPALGVVASAVGPGHRDRPARPPSRGADPGRRPGLADRARGVDALLAPGHALPRELLARHGPPDLDGSRSAAPRRGDRSVVVGDRGGHRPDRPARGAHRRSRRRPGRRTSCRDQQVLGGPRRGARTGAGGQPIRRLSQMASTGGSSSRGSATLPCWCCRRSSSSGRSVATPRRSSMPRRSA